MKDEKLIYLDTSVLQKNMSLQLSMICDTKYKKLCSV